MAHDITPTWQTAAHEDLHMKDTLSNGSSVSYANVMANIDIAPLCTSPHDPIETGTADLILELSQGGIEGLEHQIDCVPHNNKFVVEVNVDCGTGRL